MVKKKIHQTKQAIIFSALILIALKAKSQQTDSTQKWSFHFQLTVISQMHPSFHAVYSGLNSLADTLEPTATSLTSTLYIGRKLWKGAAFYFDPEISGGNGLSFTKGVAGALNGETYRVGEASPQPFVARAYLQQHIALSGTSYEAVSDDANQVGDHVPSNRITITAGKFAISDFYDDNTYNKDPRTQFFNWSLWANGAWDYPANTRGYTEGLIVELIHPTWSVRLSSVAVPRIANFHLMEYNSNAHSETLEIEHKFSIKKREGDFRFIVSNTYSQAPSYVDGIKATADNDTFLLNVISGIEEHKVYGGKKFGLFLNAEQELTNDIGAFARVGWNDGKYASWAFTEIDQTVNAGISVKGNKWKRPDDVFGLAAVVNVISNDHINFLKAGGYGFIIGDGQLIHYGNEQIIETYYNARFFNSLWTTFDYQFVQNPAYNKDRGPVHVFGVRVHIEF